MDFFSKLSPDQQMRSLANAAACVFLKKDFKFHPKGWPLCSRELTENGTAIMIPEFNRRLSPSLSLANIGSSTVCWAAGMYDRCDFNEMDESRRRSLNNVIEGGVDFFDGPKIPLNSSFRELAFNLLQSIIRYGLELPYQIEEKIAEERRVALAKVAFARLARMYPDDVPKYCRDLAEELLGNS